MSTTHRMIQAWTLPLETTDLVEHFLKTVYTSALLPVLPLNLPQIPPMAPIHCTEHFDFITIIQLVWHIALSVGLVALIWFSCHNCLCTKVKIQIPKVS